MSSIDGMASSGSLATLEDDIVALVAKVVRKPIRPGAYRCCFTVSSHFMWIASTPAARCPGWRHFRDADVNPWSTSSEGRQEVW